MNDSLPAGWEEVEFDKVLVTLESGSRPKGGVHGIEHGVPSLGGEHLNYDGSFNFVNVKYIPEAFAENMATGRLQPNDILIVKDGATTGKIGYINLDFPFALAYINEHVFLCRVSTLINAKFLLHFLRSEEGQMRILENFTGTSQGGINRSFAQNTIVPIAPFNEQNRIVAIIEERMYQVEQSRQQLQKLKEELQHYRQEIMTSAISGKLTEDWREENFDIEPAEELLERLIEERVRFYQEQVQKAKQEEKTKPRALKFDTSEVTVLADYEIPDSWFWTRLLNIAEISGGVAKGKDFKRQATISIPYLRVANVQDGYFNLSDVKTIEVLPDEKEKYLLRKGDILFTEGGDRDKLGRGAIWQAEIAECIHQNHVFKARTLSDFVLPEYISLFTKTEVAKSYFFANATQSINLSSISMTTLGNTPIALPPTEEQREILKRVAAHTAVADALEASYDEAIAEIEALPQIILAKAFAGKLSEQDPDNEPASLLLERIRVKREEIAIEV